jgi:hypothetical protein
MSSLNLEIAKEGKKLRNRILYDIYEPNIDYAKFIQTVHNKEMAQKEFLLQNLYKKI